MLKKIFSFFAAILLVFLATDAALATTYTTPIVAAYDTLVASGQPTVNFDTQDGLGLSGNEILFKFTEGDFPANIETITSFKIYFYESWANWVGIGAEATTSDWVSSTVTWNTKPTLSASMGTNGNWDTTGWKSITATVPDQATSDAIITKGLALYKSSSNNATINSIETAGDNIAYITDLTYTASSSLGAVSGLASASVATKNGLAVALVGTWNRLELIK